MTGSPRVVQAAIRGFTCAYPHYADTPFLLGEMVAVREGPFALFGVVADVESGPDDPTRPLRPRGTPGQSAASVLSENPEIGMLLRTRLSIAACGYREGTMMRPHLPPSPPPLLACVEAASTDEVMRLTGDGAFLAPLVAATVCDDAVLAAAIRLAARAYGPGAHDFAVSTGKQLARLLKAEPSRLASILRGAVP